MIDSLPEGWAEALLEGYRRYHHIPVEVYYKDDIEKQKKHGRKNIEKAQSVIEEFFERIRLSLPKAKEVHPYFKGLPCITSEYADLVKAVESEDRIEIKKQLVHLGVTCLRMYLEQYDLE